MPPTAAASRTLRAEEAELTAIAHAMREAGTGWLQIVSDFEDQQGEIGLFRRLAKELGRPVTITLTQSDARFDGWRELMSQIDQANEEGLRITAQIRSRPTSVLLGLELSQNPFIGRPSDKRIAHLPFPERLAQLRQPESRARILGPRQFEGSRRARAGSSAGIACIRWAIRRTTNRRPRPASPPGRRGEGRSPEEVAYDLLLERDGKGILYLPVTNYAGGNLDAGAR